VRSFANHFAHAVHRRFRGSAATVFMPLVTRARSQTIESDPKKFLRTDHLSLDLRGRSVRGGVVTLFSQGMKVVLQLATAMVLGRMLTPKDFGLVAMVGAILGFFGLFRDFGLGTVTVQRNDLTHRQVSTLFWINVAVGIAIMAVIAAIATFVAHFYNEPRLYWATIVSGITFPLGGLTLQHQALMRRQMRFGSLAAIEIGALAIGQAIAIALAVAGTAYWSLIYLTVATSMITMLAVWWQSPWRPGLPCLEQMSDLLRFGRHVTAVGFLTYVARNIDSILLGRMYGAEALGQYSRAYSLLMLPQQVFGPLATVAVPTLSRLQQDPARFRRAVLSLFQSLAFTMIPLAAFMIGTADWLVRIILGPQWDDAGDLFRILGFAGLTEGLGTVGVCVFMASGRTEQFLRWGMLNTTITVVAVLTGLPWGALGVSIAYAASGLLLRTPLMFWIAGTVSPVRTGDFYRVSAPFLLASAILLAVVALFRWQVSLSQPILGLMAAGAIALPTYLLVLWILPAGRQALLDVSAHLSSLRRKT
jgi:O-antigen/teichoic acid export membrane protein